MAKKRGLGKGIGALIPVVENGDPSSGQDNLFQVAAHEIRSNPLQPRKVFKEEEINELAASIRERGILQPLLVSRDGSGYVLIAGERRLRAALKAGIDRVPVILKDVDDRSRQEIALIENIQRQDLNIVEEAQAYEDLISTYGYTQDEVAGKVGKTRSVITNALRILRLPQSIRTDLLENRITMGHARAYLGVEKVSLQEEAHKKVKKKGLSVRQTEALINSLKTPKRTKRQKTQEADVQLQLIQDELRKRLATKVSITGKNEKGKIVIEYYSLDDFQRIYELLRG